MNQNVIKLLKIIRDKIMYAIHRIVHFSGLSAFLAPFFSYTLRRDIRASYNGLIDNLKDRKLKEKALFRLRRNVHRLEKGLIMKNRRKVFGLDYIEELVNIVVSGNIDFDDKQYHWALEVINKYFQVTESDDSRYLKAKHTFFGGINYEFKSKYLPYKKTENHNLNSKLHYLMQKKSVRWYCDKQIDRKLIHEAVKNARLTPSSCNRQPFRYIVITDKKKAVEVAKISGGTLGWADNIPCLVVVVASQRILNSLDDYFSPTVDASLSIMPFVLSLYENGISSCIINWVGTKKRYKKIASLIKIQKHERIVTSISLGYADQNEKVAFSKRREVNDIVDWL